MALKVRTEYRKERGDEERLNGPISVRRIDSGYFRFPISSCFGRMKGSL
jgi:hypothetical protein